MYKRQGEGFGQIGLGKTVVVADEQARAQVVFVIEQSVVNLCQKQQVLDFFVFEVNFFPFSLFEKPIEMCIRDRPKVVE